MSSIHNAGFSNNLIYDNCSYQQYLNNIQEQAHYRLYQGAYENKNKCRFDNHFIHPYDVVDVESELRNETRPASNCNMFKYNPNNEGKCVYNKQLYNVSSIQSNCFNCNDNVLQNNNIKDDNNNKGLIDNIKGKIGLGQENFTPENGHELDTYFAVQPNKSNNFIPTVENINCSSNLSTFASTAPKPAPCDVCGTLYFNNIPKRYCNGITIPEFIQ